MSIAIEGLARNDLSVDQNHALDILVNLSMVQFNYLKLNILELDIPGVIGATTLEMFVELCQKLKLNLSEDGVNEFKESRKLGNTGVLKGIIGPQTAGLYYEEIKDKLAASGNGTSDYREVNQEGIDLVKEFEGLYLKAYIDPVGVPTIGWGHTEGVRLGQIITKGEAEAFLKEDLNDAGKDVSKLVTSKLEDNQFAALVSFVFNIGSSGFANSTMRRLLNQGKYQSAANQFDLWVHGTVNGKKVVLPGLVRRRKAEKKLFLS